LSNGSILIGGYFNRYDGAPRSRIARILGDTPSDASGPLLLYPDPVSQAGVLTIELNIQSSAATGGVWRMELNDAIGRLVRTVEVAPGASWVNLDAPGTAGLYHLRLMAGEEFLAGAKLVVK
jgi:hypothetical protein